MIITRDQLRAWECCYSDEEIAALVPEEGVTPLQVLDSSIPFLHKTWVLFRSEIINEPLSELVCNLNRMPGAPDAEKVELVREALEV